MKLVSRKEILIEKYKQLVETEEKRIKKIMAKKFGFLKTDKNTFDTMGVLKTRKQSASDYNYYRQRYYRLRKITEKEIYDRMKSYVFDDYVKSLETLVKRLGLDINNEDFKQLFKEMKKLSQSDKKFFVERGYVTSMRDEYEELKKYQEENDMFFFEHLLAKIRWTKERK